MLSSEVVESEIDETQDQERRDKAMESSRLAHETILVDDQVEQRLDELLAMGFKLFDAGHVACTELEKADVLLTVDDGFLKKSRKHSGQLKVRVENPVAWLLEVLEQ